MVPEQHMPIDFDEQMHEVRQWARPLHKVEAAYHPFEHAEGTYETSMWLADKYEQTGVPVNRRALGFASLGHDIFVNTPLNETFVPGYIFASYEHRSAFFTAQHLLSRGYDLKEVVQPVHDLIVSTKNGEACTTIEAVILRMADIFNTQDFEIFKDRAEAFYKEKCLFDGEQRSFSNWLPGAMRYLLGFLDKNLPEWFKENAIRHIRRILNEHETN